jgi:uncharacterized membrane protein
MNQDEPGAVLPGVGERSREFNEIDHRRSRPDNTVALLRGRYARGEIDDDEFGRRLAALR